MLALLQQTCEYSDFSEAQILQAAGKTGGFSDTAKSTVMGKTKKDNDWIPTEAVRAILKIRDDFKGVMSEFCISQILYDLNAIWRSLMRKENDAIKKRLTA